MKSYKIVFISLMLFFAILAAACSGDNTMVDQTEKAQSGIAAEDVQTEAEYEMTTIRMNGAPLTSYAPIFIAMEEGYFAAYGIEIELVYFDRSTEAVPLMVNGDLDVFAGAVSAGLLNVLGQEADIKVVANRGQIDADTDCVYMALLIRKDLIESGEISTPADLVGHTIASTTTGPAGFLLSTVLEEAGLTLEDVNVERIPNAGLVDAFANQSISGSVTTELYLSRVLASGNAEIWYTAEDVLEIFQSSVLAFGKRLLVDEPELGARFMAAYLKGIAQYNEGKTDRNVEIIAQSTSESVETLKNACWIAIPSDGKINFSAVEIFQQWSVSQGQLETPVSEEQFWDPRVLDMAFELLGQ